MLFFFQKHSEAYSQCSRARPIAKPQRGQFVDVAKRRIGILDATSLGRYQVLDGAAWPKRKPFRRPVVLLARMTGFGHLDQATINKSSGQTATAVANQFTNNPSLRGRY